MSPCPQPPEPKATDARMPLEAFVQHFIQAWNRHDAVDMADAWLTTGDLLNTRGQWAYGREQVRQLLAEEHAGPLRETHARMHLSRLRLLSRDLVLADADMVLEGVRAPERPAPFTLHLHVTFLAQQGATGWRYLSVRPFALLSGF